MVGEAQEVDSTLMKISEVGLGKQIRESNIKYVALSDGYGSADITDIMQNSLGAYIFHEILYNLGNDSEGFPYNVIKERIRAGRSFAVLGIDAPGDDHEAGSRALGSYPWFDWYKKYGISPNDPKRTNKFMKAVTDNNGIVIFFVPPNFQKYYNGNETETYKELKYLLKHRKKAKNVIFVFGGTDWVDDTHPSLVGRTSYERHQIILQALNDWMDHVQGKLEETPTAKKGIPTIKKRIRQKISNLEKVFSHK
ncbi:hypothetical protein C4579_02990 [Candidatus Microgenomates bacterium]|nr:MAG: hypothetical protein C4579_02990 [Candidatus Microgenomates bacterium]